MIERIATRRLLVATLLLTSASCTTGRNRNSAPSQSSDVIYRDEISKTNAHNAYDAVRLLRPGFLTGRGPTTLLRTSANTTAPVIYLDNQRFGDATALRNIPLDGIVEIRYIGTTQAQMRWGMDHPAGAILVLTGIAKRTPP